MKDETEIKRAIDNYISEIWGILSHWRGHHTPHPSAILLFLSITKTIRENHHLPWNSFLDFDRNDEFREFLFSRESEYWSLKDWMVEVFTDWFSFQNPTLNYSLVGLLAAIINIIPSGDFPYFFDYILYKLAGSKKDSFIESAFPIEVNHLALSLLDTKSNDNVYNPFAGLATFGILSDKGSYRGQEIEHYTFFLAKLRMIAYEKDPQKVYYEDSVKTYDSISPLYNKVISIPPFGIQLPSTSPDFPNYRNLVHFLTSKLSEDRSLDKAVVIVSQDFISGTKWAKDVRKTIIEDNRVETLIYLPGGIWSASKMETCIICLGPAQSNPKPISLIDARSFVEKTNGKRIFQYEEVGEILQGKTGQFFKEVWPSELISNEYSFHVPRYFIQAMGHPLKTFAKRITRARRMANQIGRVVKISTLKNNKRDFILSPSEIPESDLDGTYTEVKSSAILLANFGNSLKATFFEYDNVPVYALKNEVSVFEITQSSINPYYFTSLFYDRKTVDQFDKLSSGSRIPRILISDLENIKLVVEDQTTQANIWQQLQIESRATININIELAQELELLKKEAAFLFSSLKHSIGLHRLNISSSINLIRKTFSKLPASFLEDFNIKFRPIANSSIEEVLNDLELASSGISGLLALGVNSLEMENIETEHIPIFSLISRINSVFRKTGKSYKLDFDYKENKFVNYLITSNLVLWDDIFENVRANIEKHAWDINSIERVVRIESEIIGNVFTIQIMNNGKPFPEGMTTDKFCKPFAEPKLISARLGKGGYSIMKNTRFLKGVFSLRLNSDPFFPVIYSFEFPIN